MSDDELRIAEDNIEQYLALVLRIYDRICADPESYEKFLALTKHKPEVQ